jgi:PHD/YefM family antitoxin component YafN of YafNO toxin-antitoxin module
MLKPNPSPVATSMEISEVQDRLAEIVARVCRGAARVLVVREGVPVAALGSPDDLTLLEHLDREWDERTEAIKRFSQAFADVSTEEAEAEVPPIIAERRRRAGEEEHRSA